MRHWPWVGLAVGVFCLARGTMDVLDANYLWGAAGIAAGLVLILVPIPSRTAKFDLPQEEGDRRTD